MPLSQVPSGTALRDLIIEHYDMMLSHYGQVPGVRIARKHLGWYLDGLPAGIVSQATRKTIMSAVDPDDVFAALRRIFDQDSIGAAA